MAAYSNNRLLSVLSLLVYTVTHVSGLTPDFRSGPGDIGFKLVLVGLGLAAGIVCLGLCAECLRRQSRKRPAAVTSRPRVVTNDSELYEGIGGYGPPRPAADSTVSSPYESMGGTTPTNIQFTDSYMQPVYAYKHDYFEFRNVIYQNQQFTRSSSHVYDSV